MTRKPSAPPRTQGIIFDIDGTLVDSNDLHADAWVEAFAQFDKEIDWEVVRFNIGKGGDLLVPDLLDAREMRKVGEQVKKYRAELFKRKYMRQVRAFPRMKQCLQILHERGIKLALASSANPDEVESYIEILGVRDLLEGTTSKQDASMSKPSPEIFRAALERIGTDPAHTLAVGDTPYDVLAAHRIPLAVAGVLSGGFERDLLAKAEFLFEDVQELVRKLDTIDAYFAQD